MFAASGADGCFGSRPRTLDVPPRVDAGDAGLKVLVDVDEAGRIVDLRIADLHRRLASRRPTLDLTAAWRELTARKCYGPVYGARPLRRVIAHELEPWIGRASLCSDIDDGARIFLDAEHGELAV